VDEAMTAALEMDSCSDTVPGRKAQFGSKGVTVVTTVNLSGHWWHQQVDGRAVQNHL